MNGSYWLLYLGLLSFTGAGVGLGLSISAVSVTMQQAMLYTFLIIMPLMLLSGLLTPVHNMPDALQVATWINPLRWGIALVRPVYLEAPGFPALGFDFLPLPPTLAVPFPTRKNV